jgi:hypothetical protein
MMRVFTVVLLAMLCGCGRDATKPAQLAECKEEGVQCQLPEGPLGVCEQSHCVPGQTPPCYRCIPQH